MKADFYEYLVALVPPAALVFFSIRLLLRTDVRLLGRRRFKAERMHYLFALHNAEERALEGHIVLRLEVVLKEGLFMEEPVLLCGPAFQGLETSGFKKGESRHYEVITPRLRAQSTWILRCVTNKREGDVRLTVAYGKKPAEKEEKFKPRDEWSTLGTSQEGLMEPKRWQWFFVGTLLALLTYVLPIVFRLSWPWRMEGWMSSIDGILVVALLVCSLLAFYMCRPRPVPIILGHMGWERERQRHRTKGRSIPGPPARDGSDSPAL